jgi:AraC-like DNA-binding protein
MYASMAIVRAVVDNLSCRGIATRAFCAHVGLDPRDLTNVRGELPVARYNAMLRAAWELTGHDPHVGIEVGERALATFHLVGQLAMVAGSMRHAFALLERYHPLLLEAARFGLAEHGDQAVFTFEHPLSSPDVAPLEAEGLLLMALNIGRRFAADRPALCVRFAHPCRGHLPEYHRAFGCDVRFGASRHAILFHRESLDVPHVHRDDGLCAILRAHADAWLARRHAASRFPQRVRDVLRYEMLLGNTGTAAVARRLGMSPRALQRRLRSHGHSLSQLMDEVRSDAAHEALADPRVALKEVSERLGFSEPSAFHRAFKRWTGLTPQQYRHSLRPGAPSPAEPSAG